MVYHLTCILLLPLVSPTLLVRASTVNTGMKAPIVDLGYAQYQGFYDPHANITRFLSIRYAAPPLGNLRFQAPQPPTFEPGVQSATENPKMCYQTGFGESMKALVPPYGHNKRRQLMPVASEDCLYLNVFVPGTVPTGPTKTEGLPVLVWIHGGGYQYGYAAEYNGAYLVTDSLNTMVVVIIQYRLGIFGFLPGNEVKAQGSLNAGLLDQTFALQWVQDHIGMFGGDKSHVTIWGESAGAGSVLQHIVAHGGNTRPPLFNAAIASSTSLIPQYHYNDRLPQWTYNEVVSKTGCALSRDTFMCLQSTNAEILQTVNHDIAVSDFFGTFIFVPVVDGTFIVERPTITLSKGQVNGQILLAVSNQHEGNMFVNTNETLTVTNYVSQLFPDVTSEKVQEVKQVYKGYGTAREQAIEVVGDVTFVCPTYYLLRAFSGRSWKGLFAVPPAYHGNDCIYYFQSSPPPYDNTVFIKAFSQSFLSFAKHYDINKKLDPTNITPFWEMYDADETEMLFNRTEEGSPVIVPIKTDPRIHSRCTFWSTVTSMTAQ